MTKAPGKAHRQGDSVSSRLLVLNDVKHLIGGNDGDGAALGVVGQKAVDAFLRRLNAHRLNDQAPLFAVPENDPVGRHGLAPWKEAA